MSVMSVSAFSLSKILRSRTARLLSSSAAGFSQLREALRGSLFEHVTCGAQRAAERPCNATPGKTLAAQLGDLFPPWNVLRRSSPELLALLARRRDSEACALANQVPLELGDRREH